MKGRAGLRFTTDGILTVFCGRCRSEKELRCSRCSRAATMAEVKMHWLQDSPEAFGAWLDQEIRKART